MLKKRLIPKIMMKHRNIAGKERMVLVTTERFSKFTDVGDPISLAKIFQDQAADELFIVDIDASRENRGDLLLDIIKKTTEEVFMPITVGGGIRTLDDIRALLLAGADKISINTHVIDNPMFITEAAKVFGAQCIVVSIDYKQELDGTYKVYTHCGTEATELNPIAWSQQAQSLGAGEILLTCINRDGTRSGLDISLLQQVTASVSIPVIASGGCGLAAHFIDGYCLGNADAVAAGTYFCMKDENLMQVRSQIKNAGIPIRLHQ